MKILSGKVSEMQALFQNHMVVEHWNQELEILHSISVAFQNRDLSQLTELLQTISFCNSICLFVNEQNSSFFTDPILQFHMNYLRNELMEQNFLKIVEPYDVVEIQYVADRMKLPIEEVGLKERW